ncbi:restriction endonuclease subunit S [Mammaliicoccus lentus]|uniref:restriction endonuclease subunit S n=1 Tax=Mammaliicoccus lentus TaxID=42858 RepID=UPI0007D984B1|nr:restriction endonuclease subunit S [Mammaliicoccus lentus]OAO24889.1 type I restriction endonuclease subunit S [Mammaliicoccus lentus]
MECKVSEVVKIISGGTPKRKNSEYWNGEIPWLSVKDFNNKNRLVHETEEHITEAGLNNSAATLVSKGTVIISARGTVGELCQVAKSMTFNQSCFGLEAISKYTTNEYIYYWFKYKTNYIKSNTHGSVFDTINRKTFENLYINLPNISYQKQVVNILKTLDNKIEINQNIITNLEELSQTLFKRWFVDFEFPDANGNPYKSSGGEMVDSELGEIPRGWAIGHFNQFCKKPIAGDWGKEHQQGNYNKPVRIIRGADINDYSKGGKGKSPIRFILEKNFDNKKLISGDIIVEISGGSPTQSTGRTLLINKEILQNSNYGLVCTNFCKVIRPVDEKYGEWIAYYFNYLYFRDVFFNYENGTTGIKNLDYKSILNTMKIIVPITQILNNFHNVISNYKINIQRLGKENDYLSQLRDTLLPKLMSGEIEIPDDIEVNEDELSI